MRRDIVAALLLMGLLAGCGAVVPHGAELRPPHISLADIRIVDVGLLEQRYLLDLRVQNPNPVVLPIDGMEYRLAINGDEFGRGVSGTSVRIEPYGEAKVTVDIVSNTGKALEQIRRLARGEQAAIGYRIEGGVHLRGSPVELPFTFEGRVNQVEPPAERDEHLL